MVFQMIHVGISSWIVIGSVVKHPRGKQEPRNVKLVRLSPPVGEMIQFDSCFNHQLGKIRDVTGEKPKTCHVVFINLMIGDFLVLFGVDLRTGTDIIYRPNTAAVQDEGPIGVQSFCPPTLAKVLQVFKGFGSTAKGRDSTFASRV